MKFHQFTFVFTAFMLPIATALPQTTTAAPAATLKAEYRFEASMLPTVGSGTAASRTSGTRFEDDRVDGLACTTLRFDVGNGFTVPISGVMPTNEYSFAVLFKFDQTSGYRKIADFEHLTKDTGLYVLGNQYGFFTGGRFSNTVPISPATYVQAALTRQANKLVTGYVNGSRIFTFTDSADTAVVDAQKFLTFFIDDMTTSGGEASSGNVARLRVWDSALTDMEVGALDRLAPNQCGANNLALAATPGIGLVQAGKLYTQTWAATLITTTAPAPTMTLTLTPTGPISVTAISWSGGAACTLGSVITCGPGVQTGPWPMTASLSYTPSASGLITFTALLSTSPFSETRLTDNTITVTKRVITGMIRRNYLPLTERSLFG